MTNLKPTDSEQLEEQIQTILDEIGVTIKFKVGTVERSFVGTEIAKNLIMQLIQERDRQRSSAALEALKGVSSLIGDIDISKAEQALTAVLGPDNSKIEE